MNKTIIGKIGYDRTVKRILKLLEEKYSKTKGEKILNLMNRIIGFETKDKIVNL